MIRRVGPRRNYRKLVPDSILQAVQELIDREGIGRAKRALHVSDAIFDELRDANAMLVPESIAKVRERLAELGILA